MNKRPLRDRFIISIPEDKKLSIALAGLLACASLYLKPFPYLRHEAFCTVACSFRLHLQLRGQLRFYTEFPIKSS